MKKIYIFLYSLIHLISFNSYSNDRQSLGFLAFDDDTIQLILSKVIDSNDNASIVRFGSILDCTSKTILSFSSVNKFAYRLINSSEFASILCGEISRRFDISAIETLVTLNTQRSRRQLTEAFENNNERRLFNLLQLFHAELKTNFGPLFIHPFILHSYDQKIRDGLRLLEKNGTIETPWGIIQLCTKNSEWRSKQDFIKIIFDEYCQRTTEDASFRYKSRLPWVNHYIWNHLNNTDPYQNHTRNNQLPHLHTSLSLDQLPEWIIREIGNNSYNENPNTLIIKNLTFFTVMAFLDLFKVSQPHFKDKCELNQLYGRDKLTWQLSFEKPMDLPKHFKCYHAGIKDIQEGWELTSIEKNPQLKSRIQLFPETHWCLFLKKQQYFDSSLIQHCLHHFNLTHKAHCDHFFREKYPKILNEISYGYLWIRNDSIDEIVNRFGFNLITDIDENTIAAEIK